MGNPLAGKGLKEQVIPATMGGKNKQQKAWFN